MTAISAMQLHERTDNDFEVSDSVYGPELFDASGYLNARLAGADRHQPVVAKAMNALGQTVTYYTNGQFSIGTDRDPDRSQALWSYQLAPGKQPEDVRGVAIDPNGEAWVWYDDRTFSTGTVSDPIEFVVDQKGDKEKASAPQGFDRIVGMDFARNGNLYVYYDNGYRSVGSAADFDEVAPEKSYSSTPSSTNFERRYDIVGIGIDKAGGGVYAWYSDGIVTDGWSRDLDDSGHIRSYAIPAAVYPDLSDRYMTWTDQTRVDHLLSHSAGPVAGGDVAGAAVMFGLAEDALSYGQLHKYMLRTHKLDFAPGTRSDYSNHGMGLVSWVVETVSGIPFETYVRSNLFDPLGITATTNHSPDVPGDMARHKYDGGAIVTFVEDKGHDLGLGAGGWKISAGDLVRIMSGTNPAGGHPQVFASDATRQLMETAPYTSARAHGWKIIDDGLSHDGALGGGRTYIVKFDRGTRGDNLSNALINVAVCTPISVDDSVIRVLAKDVADLVAEASISSGYDLY